MRNNWIQLLSSHRGYFTLAVTLYKSLSFPRGSYREQFASCLSHSSLFLQLPQLAHAAQLYRQSAQQWQRLAEVLISADEIELQQALTAIQQGTFDPALHNKLMEAFCLERPKLDQSFRIEVLDKTLGRIIRLEHQGAQLILEALSSSKEPVCPL